jgi:hypothetical protein
MTCISIVLFAGARPLTTSVIRSKRTLRRGTVKVRTWPVPMTLALIVSPTSTAWSSHTLCGALHEPGEKSDVWTVKATFSAPAASFHVTRTSWFDSASPSKQ